MNESHWDCAEEVIYDKCQELVKMRHYACEVQYSNFDLSYVVQLEHATNRSFSNVLFV